MHISSITNTMSSFSSKFVKKNTSNNQNNNTSKPSFKGIYIEDVANIGDVAESTSLNEFLKKDALLLNAIANEYPYQDCFIRKGLLQLPRLEYREKPPVVEQFSESLTGEYKTYLQPNDKMYPAEPLILYKDSYMNRFIGLPSYISLNPSLPYTVKVGFELHKKLLEKKYQIMEIIGRSDEIDLGEETLIQKAHKAIEDVEAAVTRYLLESAFAAITDRASAKQLYASNYPKVQSRLDERRKLEVTTSNAKMPMLDPEEVQKNRVDICDIAMKNYPNMEENKERIQQLSEYMYNNGIVLG